MCGRDGFQTNLGFDNRLGAGAPALGRDLAVLHYSGDMRFCVAGDWYAGGSNAHSRSLVKARRPPSLGRVAHGERLSEAICFDNSDWRSRQLVVDPPRHGNGRLVESDRESRRRGLERATTSARKASQDFAILTWICAGARYPFRGDHR
jgi:hypothetical protein